MPHSLVQAMFNVERDVRGAASPVVKNSSDETHESARDVRSSNKVSPPRRYFPEPHLQQLIPHLCNAWYMKGQQIHVLSSLILQILTSYEQLKC